MFCPKCGIEYRQDFTRCADCDVALVASLPAADDSVDSSTAHGFADYGAADGDHLVRLWMSSDLVLHSALIAALSAADIPHFSGRASMFYVMPNLDVFVQHRHYARAKEILADLLDTPDVPGEEPER